MNEVERCMVSYEITASQDHRIAWRRCLFEMTVLFATIHSIFVTYEALL